MQQPFPNGADFRKQAREALKPDLTTALTITFLATLPSLISNTVANLNIAPALVRLQTLLLQLYAEHGMTIGTYVDKAEEGIMAFLQDPGVIGAVALMVAVYVFTPFLHLGMLASMLKLLRKEPVSVSSVLCRSRCFFKGIGLRLYTLLRVVLWMLPGLAVTLLSIPATLWLRSFNVFMFLYFAGIVMMVVLAIRALLHYAMAKLLLADHPGARIRDCVHDSVLIMRRRKKYLVLLLLMFFILMMAASVVAELFAGINTVLGLVVQMALNLILSMYVYTSVAAFYMHYERQPMQM